MLTELIYVRILQISFQKPSMRKRPLKCQSGIFPSFKKNLFKKMYFLPRNCKRISNFDCFKNNHGPGIWKNLPQNNMLASTLSSEFRGLLKTPFVLCGCPTQFSFSHGKDCHLPSYLNVILCLGWFVISCITVFGTKFPCIFYLSNLLRNQE